MSLFDSQTPKPVTLSGSTTQSAPQYLTDYLTNLAQTGQGMLGQTGGQLIAGLPQNLQDLYSGAQGTLNRYQPAMDASLAALQSAAGGVQADDISRFYDPYEKDVVNEMSRQSDLNTQRSLLPALKSAFAGSGGFGSQRYANATGQTMADVQANLLGAQSKFRSEGYKSALDAALKDRGYDIQTGQALSGLGTQEAQAATSSLKTLGDIGTQELAYNQSMIDAPLVRAQNVAKLLQGYQFPMTTNEVKQALPSAYAPSPLQQIGSLGTLVGAGIQGGLGKTLADLFKNANWSGSTGDLRSGSNYVTGGWNLGNSEAGSAAYDDSNPFAII